MKHFNKNWNYFNLYILEKTNSSIFLTDRASKSYFYFHKKLLPEKIFFYFSSVPRLC